MEVFERAMDRLWQGLRFLSAAGFVPVGLFVCFGLGQPPALVFSLLGLGMGALWWWFRPVPASADARRWQMLCGVLTIAATAGLELTAVQFLRSPAGPADVSLKLLMPTLVTGAVAVALLALRIAAGFKLRALTRQIAPPVAVLPKKQEERLAANEFQPLSGSSPAHLLDGGRPHAADETPILVIRGERSRRPPVSKEAKLYLLVTGISGVLLIGLAVLQGITTSNWGRLWAIGAAFVLALVFAIYIFVRRRGSRIEVTATQLKLVNGLGHVRSMPIAEMGSLVRCSVELGRQKIPVPTVLATDKAGRICLRFTPNVDLERLAEAVGVSSTGSFDDRVPHSGSSM